MDMVEELRVLTFEMLDLLVQRQIKIDSDIFAFNFASILTKYIFSPSSAIVFAIPKWFSWTNSITLCCNSFSMTIMFVLKEFHLVLM